MDTVPEYIMQTLRPTVLYMFAITPPPDLAHAIHQVRLNFSDKYKFKKALKPPVHITLFPPFKIPTPTTTSFEQDVQSLKNWSEKLDPFDIQLDDYNFFHNRRSPVLFIDVIRNTQLNKLHTDFLKEFQKYYNFEKPKDTYKPHITIGYRDVTPESFPAIKTDYSKQKFSAVFNCDKFFLWKHDGQNWQVLQEFLLTGKKEQLALF
jgi:2'-5' RNA ligase